VRVRSSEAAEIKFQRKDEGADASPAKKIELLVLDKEEAPEQPGFCESSSEIELDVPRGATVQLRTRDSDISVFEVPPFTSIRKTAMFSIERATRTVEVGSNRRWHFFERSRAAGINLHSAGGSIEANDIRPAEKRRHLEAHTLSGEITLDHVTHAQLSAHTA